MTTNQQINYNIPFSTLLRAETEGAHSGAQINSGLSFLVRGQLDKEEYARYLIMLWHIYSALEQGLERHATHPVLQPSYNPTLLARTSALSSDISTLLGVSELEWPSHSINQTLLSSPPTAFSAYVSHLHELSDSSDPSLLLAHSYIRYLGDLSGGQVIARATSKAYGLEHPDKLGIKFYQFSRLGGGGPASTSSDINEIKDWFRKGMDEGVGDDVPRKMAIIKETHRAYELNIGIFDTLRPPKTQPTLEDGATPPEMPAETPRNSTLNKVVSLDSVFLIVLAMVLGHSLLLAGGFTSSRWYTKVSSFKPFMPGNETATEMLSRWWSHTTSS